MHSFFARSSVIMAFALAVLAVGAFTSSARADLIAYWNFNSTGTAPATLAPSVGVGSISLTGWGSWASFDPTSTTLNALSGQPAGRALLLDGGSSSGQLGYPLPPIDINVSLAGLQNPIVTFATRGIDPWNGATNAQWWWSTDGTNFMQLPSVNTAGSSTYEVKTVDFSSVDALDNDSSVTLRLVFATGVGSVVQIMDNLQVNATAVPAPGALALLGVAGLLAGRRRQTR